MSRTAAPTPAAAKPPCKATPSTPTTALPCRSAPGPSAEGCLRVCRPAGEHAAGATRCWNAVPAVGLSEVVAAPEEAALLQALQGDAVDAKQFGHVLCADPQPRGRGRRSSDLHRSRRRCGAVLRRSPSASPARMLSPWLTASSMRPWGRGAEHVPADAPAGIDLNPPPVAWRHRDPQHPACPWSAGPRARRPGRQNAAPRRQSRCRRTYSQERAVQLSRSVSTG